MPKSSKQHMPDAIKLLSEDHEKVLLLFSEFEQLESDEENEDSKRDLVALACAELTIHAQLEEELFYPALRDVLDEQDLLNEAQVEHDIAKQLIAELETMEPDEELYDAKFTVLGAYTKHHIEEEQSQLFPKARKANIDLAALALDMLARKEELQAEFGLQDDSELSSQDTDNFSLPLQDDKPNRRPRA